MWLNTFLPGDHFWRCEQGSIWGRHQFFECYGDRQPTPRSAEDWCWTGSSDHDSWHCRDCRGFESCIGYRWYQAISGTESSFCFICCYHCFFLVSYHLVKKYHSMGMIRLSCLHHKTNCYCFELFKSFSTTCQSTQDQGLSIGIQSP